MVSSVVSDEMEVFCALLQGLLNRLNAIAQRTNTDLLAYTNTSFDIIIFRGFAILRISWIKFGFDMFLISSSSVPGFNFTKESFVGFLGLPALVLDVDDLVRSDTGLAGSEGNGGYLDLNGLFFFVEEGGDGAKFRSRCFFLRLTLSGVEGTSSIGLEAFFGVDVLDNFLYDFHSC